MQGQQRNYTPQQIIGPQHSVDVRPISSSFCFSWGVQGNGVGNMSEADWDSDGMA